MRLVLVSEKSQGKRLGAKQQKNSGRGKTKKGDLLRMRFLIDVKEYGKQFSLSKDVWSKVSTDAWIVQNRHPVINVVLGDEKPLRLLVFDEDVGKEMMDLWEEKYG